MSKPAFLLLTNVIMRQFYVKAYKGSYNDGGWHYEEHFPNLLSPWLTYCAGGKLNVKFRPPKAPLQEIDNTFRNIAQDGAGQVARSPV